jgi:hypothetical protein
MLFQLIQMEVNPGGGMIATTRTQPLFELAEDAAAMAEFSAARSGVDYGYDADADCWWAAREDGRVVIFIVRTTGEDFEAAA